MSAQMTCASTMPAPPYRPMTVGDWLITKLVLLIPLVGFIMLFVWAFTEGVHPSKKTFCQSTLLFAACGIVLVVLVMVVFGGIAAIAGAAAQHNQ
jgi:hypothetical protein